jgi:hypothetical protein
MAFPLPTPSGTDNAYLRFIAEQMAALVAAGGGSKSYTHTQTAPALVWTIDHNLNRLVYVVTYDTTNTEAEGTTTLISSNQAIVTFSLPVAGTALVL